jgi:hypothetical protein
MHPNSILNINSNSVRIFVIQGALQQKQLYGLLWQLGNSVALCSPVAVPVIVHGELHSSSSSSSSIAQHRALHCTAAQWTSWVCCIATSGTVEVPAGPAATSVVVHGELHTQQFFLLGYSAAALYSSIIWHSAAQVDFMLQLADMEVCHVKPFECATFELLLLYLIMCHWVCSRRSNYW